MLVFETELISGELYPDKTMFVGRATFDALNEGDIVPIHD